MKELQAFRYGDFEGVFDPSDYVQLEAFETGTDQFIKQADEAGKATKASEQFRILVLSLTDDVFDPIFGDGASRLLFGDQITSFSVVIDAFDQLISYIQEQGVEIKDTLQSIIKKYEGNRTTRRSSPKRV